MANGPAPTPAELRLLKGNGKDKDVAGRKVGRQPKTVAAEPVMPEDLGEHGARIWRLVAPELARMGILGQVDVASLEAYCRTYDLWKAHDGGRGYPALTMAMVNIGSKLGLDPAARLRMTLPEAEGDEEADIFGAQSG